MWSKSSFHCSAAVKRERSTYLSPYRISTQKLQTLDFMKVYKEPRLTSDSEPASACFHLGIKPLKAIGRPKACWGIKPASRPWKSTEKTAEKQRAALRTLPPPSPPHPDTLTPITTGN